MDRKTIDFYDDHAGELHDKYESVESPLAPFCARYIPAGARVLDIGIGSGRDLRLMLGSGLDAWGLEPSGELIALAERDGSLKGRLFQGSLPGDIPSTKSGFPASFCAITLSAVIMHIPREKLVPSAAGLRELLPNGGRLIISHCPIRPGLQNNREKGGRLFHLRTSESLIALFAELGFVLLELEENGDKLDRPGITWDTLVLEYPGGRTAQE